MRPIYPPTSFAFFPTPFALVVFFGLFALFTSLAPAPANAQAEEAPRARSAKSASTNAQKSTKSKKGAEGAKAPRSLYLGGAMNIGIGSHLTHSTVNRATTERSAALRGVSGALVLATLHGVKKNFRLGGAFSYAGLQRYKLIDSGNNKRTFGQRLILDFLMEGTVPVGQKVDLLIGGRLGLPILIPGGEFKEAVSVAMRQRYSTHGGPRFGLRVGLDFDVRYKISEVFALRAGVGYVYNHVFLLSARAESLTASGRLKQALDVSDIRFGLGFEWLY